MSSRYAFMSSTLVPMAMMVSAYLAANARPFGEAPAWHSTGRRPAGARC